MAMREGCKFYVSRTYPTGDSVRKCELDLAPEAPWRCPDDCPSYTPRLADVNWVHGSLAGSVTPVEPPGVGTDPSIASLLDEAEDIVNAAVDRTIDELDTERAIAAYKSTSLFGRIRARLKGFGR